MTSLTGVNVIQYYQSELCLLCLPPILHREANTCDAAILYKSLGINAHMILALAAVYGTMAFLTNCITTKYLTDQWGRRKYFPFLLQDRRDSIKGTNNN